VVWALGWAQVVSWGTLYYGFPLFVLPMQREFGWSLTLINGALSAGLLISGLCTYGVGTWIDRHGGRGLMTLGSLGTAVLLVVWSQLHSVVMFYAVWLLLGLCLSAILYEPAFMVLGRHFGSDARRAITTMTLIAGFASTLGIPLIETLLAHLPWRTVLLLLAALHIVICAPIHWLFVPPRAAMTSHSAQPESDADDGRSLMRQRLRDPVLWGMVLWFTAYSVTAAGLVFQLVPSQKALGVASNTLLMAVALIGPAQVAGRVVMMWLGERADLRVLGALTTSLVPLAILILILGPPTLLSLALFACVFGMANGITTILRGIAPGEWLGRQHLARTMGLIGAPMLVMTALAPLLTAAVWSTSGSVHVMQWTVFAISLCGALGFWFAVIMGRRGAID
jgi:MFS family permease